jgi:hypothetical protein
MYVLMKYVWNMRFLKLQLQAYKFTNASYTVI